ncbi:hypothetical protein M885DRAFT_575060 [Pelagophyceae sp. CCMP2097]|nr:hypothetical protein M885DRAFT_575060 [Pelagophyceae sp. CCMP2097]
MPAVPTAAPTAVSTAAPTVLLIAAPTADEVDFNDAVVGAAHEDVDQGDGEAVERDDDAADDEEIEALIVKQPLQRYYDAPDDCDAPDAPGEDAGLSPQF